MAAFITRPLLAVLVLLNLFAPAAAVEVCKVVDLQLVTQTGEFFLAGNIRQTVISACFCAVLFYEETGTHLCKRAGTRSPSHQPASKTVLFLPPPGCCCFFCGLRVSRGGRYESSGQMATIMLQSGFSPMHPCCVNDWIQMASSYSWLALLLVPPEENAGQR